MKNSFHKLAIFVFFLTQIIYCNVGTLDLIYKTKKIQFLELQVSWAW
jgi:hypothetical protein